MRVDAAVRDEPEQVHVAASLARTLECADERRVLEERTVADRDVHALEILEQDPTGADCEMTDLGVAHLALGQAHGLTRCLQGRVRIAAPEPVEDRCLRELDRIARPGRRAAPTVEDDERYEVDAARQIAVKESGSSDAPPTRAPSTEG